LQVSAALHCFM